jgi:hypothetical protein
MKKRSVLAAALLGTLLLLVPVQSQAFFGFFGGGFSFGTGWGGWGGPGWWGPGWWGPGWHRARYLGWPGYRWNRAYWRRPYYWHRFYRPYYRPFFGYGWLPPFSPLSVTDEPAAPSAPKTIEK